MNQYRNNFSSIIIVFLVVFILFSVYGIYKLTVSYVNNPEEKEVTSTTTTKPSLKPTPIYSNEIFEYEYTGQVLAGVSSKLFDFNENDYNQALASDKLVVLYFYANWCPICKEEIQSSLLPFFNELIEENIIGFRVNFNDGDTSSIEKNLAREYGIIYQHSKIFIKDRKTLLKSPEQWNKDRYILEVSRFR